jgi:hypothetical protein
MFQIYLHFSCGYVYVRHRDAIVCLPYDRGNRKEARIKRGGQETFLLRVENLNGAHFEEEIDRMGEKEEKTENLVGHAASSPSGRMRS